MLQFQVSFAMAVFKIVTYVKPKGKQTQGTLGTAVTVRWDVCRVM